MRRDALRARASLAGLAVANLVLAVGCTTLVAGTPQAVTTGADPASSSSTPTNATAPTRVTSPATRTGSTSSSPRSTASRSAIRPMPPIETTPRSSERSTTAVTRIAGIDLDALTAALRSSHVAGVRSAADLDAVRSLVEAARANGLRLSVVCIGTTIGNDTTSRIAEQLFDRIDGTVVVLSPSLVSARSDQLTDAQRDTAVQSAAAAHSDQQAVSRFIDSALAFIDAGGTVPATSSSPGPRTVGGIPIDPIVAALGHDHIAIAKGVTGVTVQQLSGPVEHAWSKHLHLSVAILADDPSGHLYSVADAIKDRTGGTVIVVSPKRYAIASDSFDDQRLHAALQAGQDAAGDADFVTAVVASLLD